MLHVAVLPLHSHNAVFQAAAEFKQPAVFTELDEVSLVWL